MAERTPPPAWFACVGRPLAAADRAALAALVAADAELARAETGNVAHWHEAGEFVRALEWDGAWWDHEEEERARLWERAAERCTEGELAARLAARTAALAGVVHAAAAAAPARDGGDSVVARAAGAAALMAAHQHALAGLAGAGATHYFGRKYALFAGGRWPLGFHHGRYLVF